MKTIKDQVEKWNKANSVLNKKDSLQQKRNSEKLSHRDVEELMGVYRPVYRKCSGVIKQKRG